jgi:four helix bundle protein
MATKSYRDLEVWQKATRLVVEIYSATKSFPKEELYALTNQIRRAAVSIPSNIAEGRSKRTTREFMRSINIASGSVAELETQLIIGEKLGYISAKQLPPLLEEAERIGRMLNGLYSGLEKKLSPPPNPEPQTPE